MPLLDKSKNSPNPFLGQALDRLDESRGQGGHTALLAALARRGALLTRLLRSRAGLFGFRVKHRTGFFVEWNFGVWVV